MFGELTTAISCMNSPVSRNCRPGGSGIMRGREIILTSIWFQWSCRPATALSWKWRARQYAVPQCWCCLRTRINSSLNCWNIFSVKTTIRGFLRTTRENKSVMYLLWTVCKAGLTVLSAVLSNKNLMIQKAWLVKKLRRQSFLCALLLSFKWVRMRKDRSWKDITVSKIFSVSVIKEVVKR